jgi:hypothetical protein
LGATPALAAEPVEVSRTEFFGYTDMTTQESVTCRIEMRVKHLRDENNIMQVETVVTGAVSDDDVACHDNVIVHSGDFTESTSGERSSFFGSAGQSRSLYTEVRHVTRQGATTSHGVYFSGCNCATPFYDLAFPK